MLLVQNMFYDEREWNVRFSIIRFSILKRLCTYDIISQATPFIHRHPSPSIAIFGLWLFVTWLRRRTIPSWTYSKLWIWLIQFPIIYIHSTHMISQSCVAHPIRHLNRKMSNKKKPYTLLVLVRKCKNKQTWTADIYVQDIKKSTTFALFERASHERDCYCHKHLHAHLFYFSWLIDGYNMSNLNNAVIILHILCVLSFVASL